MKLLIHDYSGHPFQAQLSRELARRGHTVQHAHCASYVSGKGQLVRVADDADTLAFVSVDLGDPFDKYTLRRRLRQERTYAQRFTRHVIASRPDIVLMCNVPLVSHALISRQLAAHNIPTAFWHQDVYSYAIGIEARRRFGPLGLAIAYAADRTEAWIARQAETVIAISDLFLPVHERWGVEADRIHVIPNWGPVDEVKPRARDNDWAKEHDLVGRPVLLYSGTLGLKHDSSQLVVLLRGVRRTLPDAELLIISDGPAADRLRHSNEPGLTVLPFQPFDRLPDVLASGDLLITILEPAASNYSVPSKTLTYLCAGRPVLALLPRTNPASSVVTEAGGLAADLSEVGIADVVSQVSALLGDPSEVERRGSLARAFAEDQFDIGPLTDRFEAALGLPRMCGNDGKVITVEIPEVGRV